MATNVSSCRAMLGNDICVRATLDERLPTWTQPLISRISGRPREGETPLVSPPLAVLVTLEVAWLIGSLFLLASSLSSLDEHLLLAPVYSAVAIGRFRWFQTELCHFAIHGEAQPSWLWAALGTLVPFATNEDAYFDDHMKHHRLGIFGTVEDPDGAFLAQLGFAEMQTSKSLMRLLIRTLISPSFHGRFLFARAKSNLCGSRTLRRIAGWTWFIVLCMPGIVIFDAKVWAATLLLTLVVGYQISALLQFTSEHYWYAVPEEGVRRSSALSHGRFCMDPAPEARLGWIKWFARLWLVHLPARLAVLPGSLPAHDAHHVAQREVDSNWIRAIYIRTALISDGADHGMAEREVWGLGEALRAVFRSIEDCH